MTPPHCITYDKAVSSLKDVYLEDSYVLDITATEDLVRFTLDLVLTPSHPEYREPGPNEQYCYRRAQVVIEGATSVRWVRRTMHPFRDATGELDYGSVDSWCVNGDVSRIAGEWGELEVSGGHVRLALKSDNGDCGGTA
jgi:hypothetical protein